MEEIIKHLLREKNIHSHQNSGILVCNTSIQEGFDLAKQILYNIVDKKTVLYLSGGRTPKDFYSQLAKEEVLHPGIVGLVDERFGPKFHQDSNERMLQESGLLRYLQMVDIPFYPILQDGKEREETAAVYDQTLRILFATYQKHVALLGIGLDGHTAGVIGSTKSFVNPLFAKERSDLLVSEFENLHEKFKERITMTFLGLSMMDLLLVLVFGDDKKEALELLFKDGSEEEVPARFFKRPDISKKTLVITDQEV